MLETPPSVCNPALSSRLNPDGWPQRVYGPLMP